MRQGLRLAPSPQEPPISAGACWQGSEASRWLSDREGRKIALLIAACDEARVNAADYRRLESGD